MKIPFQRAARGALITIEIAILGALILAARCANYQEVFVGGNIYFTDADCYARMTRVRMVAEQPGLIVRHHEFENFPAGTTPHTTVPFDYLILALSILLKPFTAHAIDLAGAVISPVLALLGGWFLWWWSRQMKLRYRWMLLILYAISPILVHGAELGRPDHQSLSILLVTIAICAEWTLGREPTRQWSIVSGIAWGLAIWVSAYEPLLLLLLVLACHAITRRSRLLDPTAAARRAAATAVFNKHRRIGWIFFAAIVAIAFLIERRIPSLSILYHGALFNNWARTIGELAHVSPGNPGWLRWCGYLLLVAPFLIWVRWTRSTRLRSPRRPTAWQESKNERLPLFVVVLLASTYCLTIWQARWAYFFVLLFALALPALLEPIKSRTAVWIAFALSLFPILRDWDERLWPNEAEFARRVEQRNEAVQLHDLALSLKSPEVHAFLAPWWLSPSIAYWSAQPGLAGSSHEGLAGIEASARFLLSSDWGKAREILENHKINWIFAYDAGRVAENAAAILSSLPTGHELCFVLDRTPTRVPRFLILSAQTPVAKLYRVVNNL